MRGNKRESAMAEKRNKAAQGPPKPASWLLVLPVALIEVVLLLATLVVGWFSPKTGLRITRWSIRTLPGPEWYGIDSKRGRERR